METIEKIILSEERNMLIKIRWHLDNMDLISASKQITERIEEINKLLGDAQDEN